MLYWVLFYIVQIFCLLLAEFVTKQKHKKLIYSVSAIIAIYFSAFRDGLGMDYDGYIMRMDWHQDLDFEFGDEILFNVLSVIIESTSLSPVFYFLVCSTVTIGFIWRYLTNSENKFIFLSVLFFISVPGMYFNTFNITRQFFATAIFLYSLTYVETRSLIKYSLCIIVAVLMHTSAIILWPLYFVLNRRFALVVYAAFIVLAVAIALNVVDIVLVISVFGDKYETYLDVQNTDSTGLMTLISVVICGGYFIYVKNKEEAAHAPVPSYIIMSVNLLVAYTTLSFLTLINVYFMRLSIYFIPSLCVMLPYVFYHTFKNKALTYTFCILISLVYFYTLATSTDPLISPDRILPISSLFD